MGVDGLGIFFTTATHPIGSDPFSLSPRIAAASRADEKNWIKKEKNEMEKYDRQNLIIVNSTMLAGLVDLSCVACSILAVNWDEAGWAFLFIGFAVLVSFGWWFLQYSLGNAEKG